MSLISLRYLSFLMRHVRLCQATAVFPVLNLHYPISDFDEWVVVHITSFIMLCRNWSKISGNTATLKYPNVWKSRVGQAEDMSYLQSSTTASAPCRCGCPTATLSMRPRKKTRGKSSEKNKKLTKGSISSFPLHPGPHCKSISLIKNTLVDTNTMILPFRGNKFRLS